MATSYKTPGVYIVEKNAFPNSAVAVATAVPVFIGYTEKAEKNNESLLKIPTRITSMKEYEEYFGAGFKSTFTISEVADKADAIASAKPDTSDKDIIKAAIEDKDHFSSAASLHNILIKIAAVKADKDITGLISYFNNGAQSNGTAAEKDTLDTIEKETKDISDKDSSVNDSGGADSKTEAVTPEITVTDNPTNQSEAEGVKSKGQEDTGGKKDDETSVDSTDPVKAAFEAVNKKITAYKNAKDDKEKKLASSDLIETAKINTDAVAKAVATLWKTIVASANNLAVTNQLHTIKLNGKDYSIDINQNNSLYFYNAVRLFYANGGSICYILSLDNYANKESQEVKYENYVNSSFNVFDILKTEFEPTLVVLPDASVLEDEEYNSLNQAVLQHCSEMGSRFGLFDVKRTDINTINRNGVDSGDIYKDAKEFRSGIGINNLKYGAAYYPWLKTSIVQSSEIDFENLNSTSNLTPDSSLYLGKLLKDPTRPDDYKSNQAIIQIFAQHDGKHLNELQPAEKIILHQSLVAVSPNYSQIMTKIRSQLNELPPSAAMAGIYTFIDNSRGVWKAPANVSLNMVNEPSFNITDENQADLNIDAITGKSINVIRSFPGLGTLVWGARTLEGNSQDWRYINVRRTLIMIEQSLKLATRAYIFEPNDAGTWVTVSSMYDNFLYNLWRQGALAGATPEQAYNVQIGLGVTMTPNDILDGLMRITVKVAIVRPAEFIEITFQQQLQQS